MARRPSKLQKLHFNIRKLKEQSNTPGNRKIKVCCIHRAELTGQRGLDPEDQLGHTHQGWRQIKGQDANNPKNNYSLASRAEPGPGCCGEKGTLVQLS